MTTILLVEDNEVNREMMRRRLQRRGYEVTEAIDGQEAITKAQTEHPSVILMDMSLPIIDGWEATARLKADAATSAIPIIGLTAHAMIEDKQKALNAGCNDYATKPVEFEKLLAMIEHFIVEPTQRSQRYPQNCCEPISRRE
jgi:two-component system, cell cycle response regulator DivK